MDKAVAVGNGEIIRNIAVVAHAGAGKTTLIESLLLSAGAIKERGRGGGATMLTEPEELQRGTAITNHLGYLTWRGAEIHFVDTPGDFDFLENARGVLPAVDGVLFVFTASEGIKPEGERLWHMVRESKLPVLGFINQIDQPQSDLAQAVTQIERAIGRAVEPIAYPLRRGGDLIGVIDLVREKASVGGGAGASESPIPASMQSELVRARTHMIERVVEQDDGLLEHYLAGGEISTGDLIEAMRGAMRRQTLVPVLCGAGIREIGVTALLDYLVGCMPGPEERDQDRPVLGSVTVNGAVTEQRRFSRSEPFCAQVIKTVIDPFFGKLSMMRVFSGEVSMNQLILNSKQQARQKAGHTYLVQGKEIVAVERLKAGDIGAIAKLDQTHTGDTLCDPAAPIVLPDIHFAPPPVTYAVNADARNEDKVSAALNKLADEDPSLHFYRDEQSHQMILAGMGRTHIDVTLERLERKFGAHAELSLPRVPYRETIVQTVKVQGKIKKQTGGHGQFANTWLEVAPLARGAGFEFVDRIVGGVIPRQYIPSVKRGVEEAMKRGPISGAPVVDIRVTLYDGSYHDVDSSDFAFQAAGAAGLRAALEQARPQLLEPIMQMRIEVPEECSGAVMKDLTGRRGRITGMEADGSRHEIHAEVPLAEVREYGQQLSGLTSGRGSYTMHLTAYHELPQQLFERVVQEGRAGAEAGQAL